MLGEKEVATDIADMTDVAYINFCIVQTICDHADWNTHCMIVDSICKVW